MIVLLGATGYVGQALAEAMHRRKLPFLSVARSEVDYASPPGLRDYLRRTKPAFVINAAGFTGKPNVDACEARPAETLAGNALFPLALAMACAEADIPWGHVSSGCIYSGCLVERDGLWVAEKDVNLPEVRRLAIEAPHRLRGFDESMAPNFSFRDGPCSFYSGSKALGEEAIAGIGRHYVWRLRIPFDHRDGARNYLSKLIRYERVYDALNSLSRLDDFAEACLDCIVQGVPFGTYNVVNPGFVSAREVVEKIRHGLRLSREFRYWEGDREFYRTGAAALRSNCLLDPSKLLRAGVRLRPVGEALDQAIAHWVPERATELR
jgi:dTDP-4-dehydrorhamnose reductase